MKLDTHGPAVPANPSPHRRRQRWFHVAALTANLLFLFAVYMATVAWRSKPELGGHQRFVGQPYGPSEVYGTFPRPNVLAYHAVLDGEQVPVAFDRLGLRVPVGGEPPLDPGQSVMLFLGDSFTHGFGVTAEQSFVELAAARLGARGLNAGGSGWGLAQMVLRGRDLIPQLRPDVVVVQYSSWLAERSMVLYRENRLGRSPVPYFAERNGRLVIEPPVFQPVGFDLPIAEYSRRGLMAFSWRVGLPFFLEEDALVLRSTFRKWLGRVPPPASDETAVTTAGFAELAELCRAHEAKMVVLALPYRLDDPPGLPLASLPGQVVDAMPALLRHLPKRNTRTWSKHYNFWRGDPPRVVDRHPNAEMHGVIAEALATALR